MNEENFSLPRWGEARRCLRDEKKGRKIQFTKLNHTKKTFHRSGAWCLLLLPDFVDFREGIFASQVRWRKLTGGMKHCALVYFWWKAGKKSANNFSLASSLHAHLGENRSESKSKTFLVLPQTMWTAKGKEKTFQRQKILKSILISRFFSLPEESPRRSKNEKTRERRQKLNCFPFFTLQPPKLYISLRNEGESERKCWNIAEGKKGKVRGREGCLIYSNEMLLLTRFICVFLSFLSLPPVFTAMSGKCNAENVSPPGKKTSKTRQYNSTFSPRNS